MVTYRYFKNGKINLLINGVLVAAISIADGTRPSPFIKHLDTKKDYQGKGYGSLLLSKVITEFEHKEAVSLYVDISNTGAIRLYRRFGFFIAFSVHKKKDGRSFYCMTKKLH